MPGIREVKDGVQVQAVSEEIPYSIDFTDWPNPPTSPTLAAEDSSGADKTSTLFPSGSPSINGNIITLPLCKAGTVGEIYKVTVGYTWNTTTKLSCYFYVRFEDD